jgi:uncharacterized PurR-regulated membrane protein YhhQ (DUF165 family)
MKGYLALAGFAATIPAANWLIGNVGTVCIPDGPCIIPVGFGLSAPSGVLAIGAAMVLRDAVQRLLGFRWALAAIVGGVILSALIAPPALVIASAVAFALSELADLSVYTPLQKRGLIKAVVASSVVGAFVDSAVFLQIAFGSLDFLAGQVLGKVWVAIAAIPVILWARR